VWQHTPLLLLMNVAVAIALLPALLLLLGGAAIAAPFAAALAVGPVWAATIATTDRMAVDEPVSALGFARGLRRHCRAGLRIAAVPALVASSLLTAGSLVSQPSGGWVWVGCLVAGLIAAGVVVLALPFVFSLATTAGIRGRRAWVTALLLAGHRPGRTLTLLALVALAAALSNLLGPGVLLLAPSLVALRCSAAIPFEPNRHEDADDPR
jgi:hypothetical protein